MDNKSIIKKLKLTIQLMELHEENPFKIRSYQSAVNTIDRGEISLVELDQDELQKINGIGKSIAEVIRSLIKSGTFPLLEELLSNTPEGLLEVMQLKGLGPKKIKTLWKELGITSTHELMEACQSGQVAGLKGFGQKTQDTIIAALEFQASNVGKFLYAEIEETSAGLDKLLKERFGENNVVQVGEYARNHEIISDLEWLIISEDRPATHKQINSIEGLVQNRKLSSPYTWVGQLTSPEITLRFRLCTENALVSEFLIRTSSPEHLNLPITDTETMAHLYRKKPYSSPQEVYEEAGMQYIPTELREGYFEVEAAKENKLPKLVENGDLKGILHNHSTYSDGKHSLREMAEQCRDLGYEYLGISDHSQTAVYAGGLDVAKIERQHQEIDELSKELAPFKIFKGIESDILGDGSLDYPDEVLAKFDFIVSSIHSVLNMDTKKATARLLKAIQNPYTTILGHPTGRLLLRRDGYPIDHKTIIDACAKYNVAIEINANPWRLDLDWRWVHYALTQNVKIAINPDSHDKNTYNHMHYGVLVGRKGGLSKDMTLNALNKEEMEAYFENRKSKIKQ
ncbi:DNA polymerase/3'-5' exonuclease PolX [Litoribacter ruber]|uniref:DNA polymerase/3'-5' exonuclease PolX n=1 Tax=Litoribacter ruber TaxID=702568 RepID=UPI001BD946CB|nr:DNA polymerase/3'-5' exonuclease PolX [Litoribacter ruber]MBT0811933.1 DNA polymerase/3'-5' exonuclease PolX [Litoribacter ruber]